MQLTAACAPRPMVCSRGEYFILRGMVVPLAHDLVGGWVVQRGEGLVGEFAKEVFLAVDFDFEWTRLLHFCDDGVI